MEKRMYYVGVRADRFRKQTFYKFAGLTIAMMIAMVAIMVVAMDAVSSYYQNQINKISQTYAQNLEVLETKYQGQIDELNATIEEQNTLVETLTAETTAQRADSAEMFELARKYWYVFRDAPDNSGLTMDDMAYLDNLCKEKDLNPHIMWCIYDNESGYTAVIDNFSGSSARGLGQVLKSTGKAMYENIMKLGTYSHDMAYDPQINMNITTTMIDRNIDNGLKNAIALYSGDATGAYYNKILATAANHGVSLSDTGYQ